MHSSTRSPTDLIPSANPDSGSAHTDTASNQAVSQPQTVMKPADWVRVGQTLNDTSKKSTALSRGPVATVKQNSSDRQPPLRQVQQPVGSKTNTKSGQNGPNPATSKGARVSPIALSRRSTPFTVSKADAKPPNNKRANASTTARISTRTPPRPQSEAEKWKVKYEQQLAETQKLQSEKEEAENGLKKIISKQTEKLAAVEARCEQTDNESAEYVGQLVKVRADLEIQRQEISEFKDSKEKLYTELTYLRDEFGKLEYQAELAGELQTQLNFARHSQIPQLEQENKALKEELRQVLDDVKMASNLKELNTLREASELLAEENKNAKDNVKSSNLILQDDHFYITQLEQENKKSRSKQFESVMELNDQENHIVALQTENSHLKRQYEDAILKNEQLMRDIQESQTKKQALRMTSSTTTCLSDEAKLNSTSSAMSLLSGVISTVQTEPLAPCRPTSESLNIIAGIELDANQKPSQKLAIAQVTAISVVPSQPHFPQPPLDRDLHITVSVKASAHTKLSLLERLAEITTKGTSFEINGPDEIANALARGMENSKVEAAHTKAKLAELQSMLWNYIQKIERMKKDGCSIAHHKNLADELAAMQARLDMQDVLLADYGRQLARFKAVQ